MHMDFVPDPLSFIIQFSFRHRNVFGMRIHTECDNHSFYNNACAGI